MNNLLQVIDGLCRLLQEAVEMIHDEAAKQAMLSAMDDLVGEEKVKI